MTVPLETTPWRRWLLGLLGVGRRQEGWVISALACPLLCSLLSAALALPTGAAERDWVPVDCNDRPEELRQWRREAGVPSDAQVPHRRRPGDDRPGGSQFIPHPDPALREEVVANFLHGYFHGFFRDRDQVSVEERPIYEALRAGRIRFGVERLVNWGVSRCGSERPIPHRYLVRLFDREGREVSRGGLGPGGELGRYMRMRPGVPQTPEPARAGDLVRDRYGLDLAPQDAQLVTLDGMPWTCSPMNPCLAFRAEGRVWLVGNSRFGHALYEVPADGRRLSMPEWRRRQEPGGASVCGEDRNAPLVSLGFEWAEARRVAGQERGTEGE